MSKNKIFSTLFSGQLHIQSKLSGGQASAHTTEWSVPLREWVRLDISQMNSLVSYKLSG